MDIQGVLEHLPHRYPFLLIDRVLECQPGERIVAIKNVTVNEPIFTGHFPGRPIFPGVLIMEALAQAGGILAFRTTETKPDGRTLFYYAGIDNCRFKQPVLPGDQLRLEVEILKAKRTIWKFKGEAKVDGKIVAEAELMCAQQEVI
ncbi:MAG: 3-hydroxyacyl-ACP dehydratase FabZ [Gammaproteobacteria bacterium]|nr:3-hydroxyacyl-ACP dehydratase FabZ [Gammaproteobacteria bacterium]